MKRGLWIGKFVVLGILFVVLFGLLTQFLWNYLVPTLFSGPIISFWQALGLLLLSKILFSGFSGSKNHYRKHQWKERYSKLSPEDKERFKAKFKEKWCAWEGSPKQSTMETQQNFSEPKI